MNEKPLLFDTPPMEFKLLDYPTPPLICAACRDGALRRRDRDWDEDPCAWAADVNIDRSGVVVTFVVPSHEDGTCPHWTLDDANRLHALRRITRDVFPTKHEALACAVRWELGGFLQGLLEPEPEPFYYSDEEPELYWWERAIRRLLKL